MRKRRLRHLLNSTGQDGIRGKTPYLVTRIRRDGRSDLFVTGVRVDLIHDESGGLHFAERIMVCDSSHFDTLLVIPL
ncbi:MAG: hypothetical protein JO045_06670 [Mycobacterium sp.]|nr:hypothetical protein [Mycobacterium sp.]